MIFQVSQDLDNSNDEEYYTLLKRKRFDVKDGRAVLFVVRMGISKARNGNIIQAWVRRMQGGYFYGSYSADPPDRQEIRVIFLEKQKTGRSTIHSDRRLQPFKHLQGPHSAKSRPS